MISEPEDPEFTLKCLNLGLDACLIPSRRAGRNQDRTNGLGKARVSRTRLSQPLVADCGVLAGIGRAEHRVNLVSPFGSAAMPGSVWSQVETAAPVSGGLWVPLGALWLSFFTGVQSDLFG